MSRPLLLMSIALALCSLRCAPPASTGDFNSPNPASKLYAIRAAGESGDAKHVPQLIEQLDNDDPAVRLFAINALERITGTRRGYNPYADDSARRESIEAWVAAVKNDEQK